MISACLAGDVVRYDGKCIPMQNRVLESLNNKGVFAKCCPEVAGGLSIPRAPAQIVGGNGSDVLAGRARVVDIDGKDVTLPFIKGAEYALSLVRTYHVQVALLKEKSPSCGSRYIYDGTFGGRVICGHGVTSAILKPGGIRIFSESEIPEFKTFVKQNFSLLHSNLGPQMKYVGHK